MDYKHIHFIGIGGIGMSGIASILRSKGIIVSGSDIKKSRITDSLKNQGIRIYLGHNSENIRGADLVVYSSAINADNAELRTARGLGINVIERAECLAELMKGTFSIVVVGSHGKTTTSSLASYMLASAGFEPTAVIGGIVNNWDNNIYLGASKYFVAEADESDGTFLKYAPDYSIITNIDSEHLDFYKNYSRVIDSFAEFAAKTKEGGCIIGCGDDVNIKKILDGLKRRSITFGFGSSCDITADKVSLEYFSSSFNCIYNAKRVGNFKLSVPGLHNVSNSLSVIALGLELGIDKKVIYESLLNYRGIKRRFQVKAKSDKYIIIDDYAHHPTEIKATLAALAPLLNGSSLRNSSKGIATGYKRVIAVFQPHRYSRTKHLLDEFAQSFSDVDHLIITDIYAAGEAPIEGISAEVLCDKIKKRREKNIEFVRKDKVVSRILNIISHGDIIITLGAGDIGKLTDELSIKIVGKN